jgi:hypothetical protein
MSQSQPELLRKEASWRSGDRWPSIRHGPRTPTKHVPCGRQSAFESMVRITHRLVLNTSWQPWTRRQCVRIQPHNIARLHSSEDQNRNEDGCLLGCCAVESGRNWPTFQRCLLPPSSGWWVSRAWKINLTVRSLVVIICPSYLSSL